MASVLAICKPVFKFVFAANRWEDCPKHHMVFSSVPQHTRVMTFLHIMAIFPAFQCLAGLVYLVCSCQVVALYFKYLKEQLEKNLRDRSMDLLSDNVSTINVDAEWKDYSISHVRRVRVLYEHVCGLAGHLNEGFHLYVGTQILVEIPMICLYMYNAFVPVFRLDFIFYGLFTLAFCSTNLIATANLNHQVWYFLMATWVRGVVVGEHVAGYCNNTITD